MFPYGNQTACQAQTHVWVCFLVLHHGRTAPWPWAKPITRLSLLVLDSLAKWWMDMGMAFQVVGAPSAEAAAMAEPIQRSCQQQRSMAFLPAVLLFRTSLPGYVPVSWHVGMSTATFQYLNGRTQLLPIASTYIDLHLVDFHRNCW